ncbi:MAG: apolipoprotein N-acyltransferase [Spirochaetales bacterium]
MRIFLQVFFAFFSAIITSLSLQNEILLFGSPFLGLFSLVPLYFAISQSKSFREAGFLTALQFLTVHLISSFWLAYFKDFAVFTLGATAVVYTIYGYIVGQLFFIPFFLTKKTALQEYSDIVQNSKLVPQNNPLRIFMFACVWTLYEWYRSIGFLGYPWGTLIMSAWKWNLITQIVSVTGTWGISFLFSLFNAVIAEGFLCGFKTPYKINITQRIKSKQAFSFANLPSYTCSAFLCMSLFICSFIYGIYEYTKEREVIKTIHTVLVQSNIDPWAYPNDYEAIQIGKDLTLQALQDYDQKADLVMWSESNLMYYYPDAETHYQNNPVDEPLSEFIAKTQTPFIIGGAVEINQEKSVKTGMRQFNNSALYYDKDGNWIDFYGKIHLVPFAEIIPHADSTFVQNFMQSIVGFSSGWAQGEYYTLFDVPLQNGETAQISTPICFEDAFPHICRHLFFAGSEAFFNITNDSWSKTNSAEIQHFVIASYRAQEFRTTLVRSTAAGFTTVTDPAGRILYSLPLFESTSGAFAIPIYERQMTPYALLGDWLPYVLLILYAGFFVYARRFHRH